MSEERLSEVEPGRGCSEAPVASALADPSLGITHLISVGYPPLGIPRATTTTTNRPAVRTRAG